MGGPMGLELLPRAARTRRTRRERGVRRRRRRRLRGRLRLFPPRRSRLVAA